MHLSDELIVGLLQDWQVLEIESAKFIVARGGRSILDWRMTRTRRCSLIFGTVYWGRSPSDSDRIFVVEELRNGTTGVEIISGFRICDLRHELRFSVHDVFPINAIEERMVFNVLSATISQSLLGISAHEAFHKIPCLRRELHPILVPFDLTRDYVLENLFRGVVVERWYTIQKFVRDNSKSPLGTQLVR